MPDQIFHLGYVLLGDFDARPGRDFQIDGELAGIGLREESQSQQRIDRQAEHKHARQCSNGEPRSLHRSPYPALIKIQKTIEHAVEAGVEAVPPGTIMFCSTLPLSLQVSRAVRHSLQEARTEKRRSEEHT